jgi:hypothetical protein
MVRMTAAFPTGRQNRTRRDPEPCPADWPSAETTDFMMKTYGRALTWEEYRARRDRFVTDASELYYDEDGFLVVG